MVRAGLASVMCSYNKVNGTQACESEELLERDLRERLGFKGWVMGDWWAAGRAGGKPASRGLDQNMPGNDRAFDEYYVRHDNDRSDDFYVRHSLLQRAFPLLHPACSIPPHSALRHEWFPTPST